MTSRPTPTKVKSRRPLTLHVSALSDAEYVAYTSWLSEIVGPLTKTRGDKTDGGGSGGFGNDSPGQTDGKLATTKAEECDWDPEGTLVSVREARGWIRGRWGNGPHALGGAVIDSILKKFSPDLSAQDVLTGGQFFAVMRMVCHSQGQVQFQEQAEKVAIDESLVFIQANPNYDSESSNKKDGLALPAFPDVDLRQKKIRPPPPPIPTPRQPSEIPASQGQPISTLDHSSKHHFNTSLAPALPPRSPNPFIRPTSDGTASINNNTPVPEISKNPFRPSKLPPPAHSSTSASESDDSNFSASKKPQNPPNGTTALPPLPPRKPAILPPPRHASIRPALNSSHSSTTSTTTYVPPPLPPPARPPKPPKVTSPLIKQSLEAAKGAQSLKASLDNLSRERQLEVIKKSGGGGGGGTPVAGGYVKDTDHRQLTARSLSPPRSMYDVATARIGGPTVPRSLASASTSASSSSGISSSSLSTGLIGSKPKLHTDTNVSNFSNNSVFRTTPVNRNLPSASPFSPSPFSPGGSNPRRTKSLHHPSPSSALPSSESSYFPFEKPGTNQPPPPPRRRPESIQVIRSVNEIVDAPMGGGGSNNPFTLQREISVQDWPPPKLASSNIITPSPRRTSASTVASHLSEPTTTNTTTTTSAHSNPSASAGTVVLDTLQRTFSSLSTLKPGPGFESARIRAEGRVLPSGFTKVGGKGKGMEKERLMDDVDSASGGLFDDHERGRRLVGQEVTKDDTGLSTISGLSQDSSMDNLKLPVRADEGWMSLN